MCSRHHCRMLHVSYRSCTPRRTLDAAFFARCLLPVVASCLRHPAYRLHCSHSLAAAALLLFGVGFAQSAPPQFARVLWSVAAMNLVHVSYSPISADRRSASHAACTAQPRHIHRLPVCPRAAFSADMYTCVRTFVRTFVRAYVHSHTRITGSMQRATEQVTATAVAQTLRRALWVPWVLTWVPGYSHGVYRY